MNEIAKHVTGLGGVFFKAADQKATVEWYRDKLGLPLEDWGGMSFLWSPKDAPDKTGYTVWSAFPGDTKYFEPSDAPFMINFRVQDLDGLLAKLAAAGVELAGDPVEEPNGKFAWVVDPNGTKIELWEPVDSDKDPYL